MKKQSTEFRAVPHKKDGWKGKYVPVAPARKQTVAQQVKASRTT